MHFLGAAPVRWIEHEIEGRGTRERIQRPSSMGGETIWIRCRLEGIALLFDGLYRRVLTVFLQALCPRWNPLLDSWDSTCVSTETGRSYSSCAY